LLPLSQNTALFSLLGTTYGGDGKSNFALPDLQGRAPMFWGQGPGLSLRDIGESSGSQAVTLLATEMPNHAHTLMASTSPASSRTPTDAALARSRNGNAYQTAVNQNVASMAAQAVSVAGGDQPHNNMQPYLGLSFIIALQGIFPPRS
jgi:microcystin-dependent protein